MNRFAKTFLAIAIGTTALSSSLPISAYANEKTVMVGGAELPRAGVCGLGIWLRRT